LKQTTSVFKIKLGLSPNLIQLFELVIAKFARQIWLTPGKAWSNPDFCLAPVLKIYFTPGTDMFL